MQLEPLVRVDGLPFTATPQEVRQRLGAPLREARNDVELDELDYGEVVSASRRAVGWRRSLPARGQSCSVKVG